MIYRSIAWALIATLTLGPLAPVLRAQGVDESAIIDRATQKDSLEAVYQRQQQRQMQMQAELDELNRMQPPAGVDQNAWNARRRQDAGQLQQQMQQNTVLIARTSQRLQPIYDKLKSDADAVAKSGDPEMQARIGTLVGVAGLQVVPIWGRPPPAGSPPGTPNGLGRLTAQDITGMMKYGINQAHVRTVNWRIPVYQNVANNAGSRATNAENALGSLPSVEWKPEPNPETGNMRLVAHDAALGTPIEGQAPVETSVPAKITNSQGQVVDNPNAVQGANDFAQLYNAKTQIGNEITSAKLKASRAVNNAQKEFFEKHAADLETKKAQLDADIQKYQAENPSVGERMTALGKDAGKWALMSVGVAATTNVVTQLAHNGWDPSKVNYGQAVAFLGDRHFWGGTAGSFVGSMAGSALASAVPGGLLVKTALSIGGASLGWQVGSGNLGRTDFIGLGVTTLGSTAGYLLGLSIGGPIGAFLGGIVGQYVSQYIYDAVKEMLIKEEAAQSGGAVAQVPAGPPPGVDPSQGPPGVNPGQYGTGPGGSIPNPGPYPGSPATIGTGQQAGSPGSLEDAEKRARELYDAAMAAQASGDQQLATVKLQQYQEIRNWIQMKRQAGAESGPGDFHQDQ